MLTLAGNSAMSADEQVLFWFLVFFFALGLAWRLLGGRIDRTQSFT